MPSSQNLSVNVIVDNPLPPVVAPRLILIIVPLVILLVTILFIFMRQRHHSAPKNR